jgi:hypothetical protein
MARKQCFLVCPPTGNMDWKCFVVCPPSGNAWLGNNVSRFAHVTSVPSQSIVYQFMTNNAIMFWFFLTCLLYSKPYICICTILKRKTCEERLSLCLYPRYHMTRYFNFSGIISPVNSIPLTLTFGKHGRETMLSFRHNVSLSITVCSSLFLNV